MKKLFAILLTALGILSGSAGELPNLLREAADYLEKIDALESRFGELESRVDNLPTPEPPPGDKFRFVLRDENGDNYLDEEWEEIIQKGQRLQYPYWKRAEDYWGARYPSPSGPGWHGSAVMPVIQIVCEEPEYWFRGTVRLPGRFQVTSPSRWGSLLRFHATGQTIVDNKNYGTQLDAPVGIYVESETEVDIGGEVFIPRPFEQAIEHVIIQGLNGTVPVYLAQNQDRLTIRDCKILQHQGAQVGIRHGPLLRENDYPFPATQRTGGNVHLTDPRFERLQLEGPHNNRRRQAAIFVSGDNMIFSEINAYGWNHVIYAHGGQGRVLDGLTVHLGKTSDGRYWTLQDDIVAALFCQRSGAAPDAVSGVAGGHKVWLLPKRSRVPSAGGWHGAGEVTL